MSGLYYGVAYYDEYMPYERLEQDVKMMKKAGTASSAIDSPSPSTIQCHHSNIDRVSKDQAQNSIAIRRGDA